MLLGFAGLIVVLAVVATFSTSPAGQPLGIPGKWHMVLDSEFTSKSLNTDLWRAGWFGTGVTAPVNPLENDCYNSHNVAFSGSTLELKVTHQASRCDGKTYPWTGALIDTNPHDGRGSGGFQYTYGVFQARVYIPAHGSMLADWPDVWADAQSSAAYGEDDVIEGIDGSACWHFHNAAGQSGGCDASIRPGWHTVASNWQRGSVTFYYDGTEVGRITSGVTSSPMYLLLDNTTTTDATIPDSMRVAYVRVWQS